MLNFASGLGQCAGPGAVCKGSSTVLSLLSGPSISRLAAELAKDLEIPVKDTELGPAERLHVKAWKRQTEKSGADVPDNALRVNRPKSYSWCGALTSGLRWTLVVQCNSTALSQSMKLDSAGAFALHRRVFEPLCHI